MYNVAIVTQCSDSDGESNSEASLRGSYDCVVKCTIVGRTIAQ